MDFIPRYKLRAFFLAAFLSLPLSAANRPGFDAGPMGNIFNTIRSDYKTLGYGAGGGAFMNWQWSDNWRTGAQLGCARICGGNLELGYRAYTFDYKSFRNPERVIYYILSLGTTEVWLRFVGGWNATRDYGSQGGLGVGFTLHALEIGDFFVAYGINFYFINEFMAFGLGQAFLSLAMRL